LKHNFFFSKYDAHFFEVGEINLVSGKKLNFCFVLPEIFISSPFPDKVFKTDVFVVETWLQNIFLMLGVSLTDLKFSPVLKTDNGVSLTSIF
jgi:hypothetical protein